MTRVLYHGGPLDKEHFDGHTFWHDNPHRAAEYGDELWTITVEMAAENVVAEDDFLPSDGYAGCESNDENWELQTATIRAAVQDGATVVLCDDGLCIVNAERFSPRRLTIDEADEIWQNT